MRFICWFVLLHLATCDKNVFKSIKSKLSKLTMSATPHTYPQEAATACVHCTEHCFFLLYFASVQILTNLYNIYTICCFSGSYQIASRAVQHIIWYYLSCVQVNASGCFSSCKVQLARYEWTNAWMRWNNLTGCMLCLVKSDREKTVYCSLY